MRKLPLVLVALCVPSIVHADLFGLAPPFLASKGSTSGGGSAYTGPGDIVSGAEEWYGLRAYSAAKRGNKAINVCNVSDVTCVDMVTSATTGALVITTVGGSSCSVITCTIKTWYDQTGNGFDMTNATISQRPTLTVSCVSSLPCATFDGSSQYLFGTGGGVSQPYSTSGIFYSTMTANAPNFDYDYLSSFNGSSGFIDTYNGGGTPPNTGGFAGSGLSVITTSSVWHAVQIVYNGASGALVVDGSNTSQNFGTDATGTVLAIANLESGGNRWFPGNIVEVGVWPSAFSSGNQTSMNSNQHTYWGF